MAACFSHRYARGYDPDNWPLIDPETADQTSKGPRQIVPVLIEWNLLRQNTDPHSGQALFMIVGVDLNLESCSPDGFGVSEPSFELYCCKAMARHSDFA